MKAVVKTCTLIIICIFFFQFSKAQTGSKKKIADVYVDKNGIMRWGETHEEVHAFGVNYTVPFAYAYRTAKELNINIEKAIDDDVYHFARLGFDAFRVHVWDCEISDTLGNLLSNEHLRLFDYSIKKMKERGIKFIITPIAYWGNGYPLPDEKTPGFSRKYGKDACLTNPEAIKAQENYLSQFVNHVNQYTGVAYKDEPDVIAFEVCNEPHHSESPEKVTIFIDRMIKSIQQTGCKKPVFYNISHKVHLGDAYFKSHMQGGTFQWYPTGLGAGHELVGNILPNVDRYIFPYTSDSRFKKIAKVVYEFDAADVGRSYIYPAMARSFRTAGIQVATHFAYDPTFTAYANTEYNTHYMNLVYAPQKALSLKIASEVFHTVPLYKSYGNYPANAKFDNFNISYEKDLAELITDTKFFYTNSTNTVLPAPDKLEEISGFGNSSVIKYEGLGAYFLDKIEDGVWRLEVMPDAIWVNDPYGRANLKKEVSVVNWRTWPMTIALPDLGEGFGIKSINLNNTEVLKVQGISFNITPGVYLLNRKGVIIKKRADDQFKNIRLNEFSAPTTTLKKTYVLHEPVLELSVGTPLKIEAKIVSVNQPDKVEVYITGQRWRPTILTMQRTVGYQYEVMVPDELVVEGMLRYRIVVKENNSDLIADDSSAKNYEVRILSKGLSVYLFSAFKDNDNVMRQWLPASKLVPLADPAMCELRIPVEKLFVPDNENKNEEPISDYTLRYAFGYKLDGRLTDILQAKNLVFRGRTLQQTSGKIQVALVMRDGNAFGGEVVLDAATGDYKIALADLKKVDLVTLPRPYPSFLPYYFKGDPSIAFDITKVEGIQISIGPGLSTEELSLPHTIAIESVRLE